MFKFLKNNNKTEDKNISIVYIASLLIHAARVDEKYSEKEKKIIKETLVKLGTERGSIDNIITKAEAVEENSNQILEYTKEAKNLKHESKLILIEALWDIIYSDENADMYEENLMRRLSGLLYLDKKTVGDIKEKIKNKKL
tara:strand:- start:324 stop:746 length:423 start_codon:yes stop_codon:yes gene_type:complete